MPPRQRRARGHLAQLPSGSWRAVVEGGTDSLTGKRCQLRETATTYADAKRVLSKLQRQVDEDQHPKSNITVRRAITQRLDVVELEDATRERYNDLIRLYVLPTFGDMPAGKIDVELLERFYARLHKRRQMCTAGPAAGTSAGR
ncbi:MAG: hypothetical protein ACR2MC_12850 [Actinomycetota bacterium]